MFEIGAKVYVEEKQKFGVIEERYTKDGDPSYTSYKVRFNDGNGCYFVYGYDLILADHFKSKIGEKLKELVKEPILTKEQYIDAINKTLDERGNNYGSFDSQAMIVQSLKRTMKGTPNWSKLDDDMKESLEMIQHKIARILNGNPYHHDSWHDISGYSTLVADRLDKK